MLCEDYCDLFVLRKRVKDWIGLATPGGWGGVLVGAAAAHHDARLAAAASGLHTV